MKLLTETGSVYELDVIEKRARRLQGVSDPTPRVGQDGVWKKYETLLLVTDAVRSMLLIDWTGRGNGTLTSGIVKLIIDDETSTNDPLVIMERLSIA